MKKMAGHASMPEPVKQMLREIGMDVPAGAPASPPAP
jgi:hypothetical protein